MTKKVAASNDGSTITTIPTHRERENKTHLTWLNMRLKGVIKMVRKPHFSIQAMHGFGAHGQKEQRRHRAGFGCGWLMVTDGKFAQ